MARLFVFFLLVSCSQPNQTNHRGSAASEEKSASKQKEDRENRGKEDEALLPETKVSREGVQQEPQTKPANPLSTLSEQPAGAINIGSSEENSAIAVETASKFRKPVYLFVHGLAGDPGSWTGVKKELFDRKCWVVRGDNRDLLEPQSNCYLMEFGAAVGPKGQNWDFGDAMTFDELGQRLNEAVNNIIEKTKCDSIVIVGHSRGGLAARAFLYQASGAATSIRYALITLGSPHLGSPLGRIKYFMDQEGYTLDDLSSVFQGSIGFGFAPSTGYLTDSYNVSRQRIRDQQSELIWKLVEDNKGVYPYVLSYGQLVSDQLEIGEDAVPKVNLFKPVFGIFSVASVLPGDLNDLTNYVFKNVPDEARYNSDGIVPFYNQKMEHFFDEAELKEKGLAEVHVHKVVHSDGVQFFSNRGQTGRVEDIKALILEVSKRAGLPYTVGGKSQ